MENAGQSCNASKRMIVTDAVFSKSGDARDYWTETAVAAGETISLTWHDIGDPLLIHTQPNVGPDARPYGVCTVLIPAAGARVVMVDRRHSVGGRDPLGIRRGWGRILRSRRLGGPDALPAA